jgi:PPOX class probable F420-dependent enzyme
MKEMTTDEARRFLTEGARTAKLASVGADGAPRVAPIWFLLDGEELVFTTWHTSVKARNIARDERIALLVEDEVPPYAYVIVRGRAALRDDMDELRRSARDLAARYMGADKAEEYGRRNAVPGELVVRVTPERIVGITRVAD